MTQIGKIKIMYTSLDVEVLSEGRKANTSLLSNKWFYAIEVDAKMYVCVC